MKNKIDKVSPELQEIVDELKKHPQCSYVIFYEKDANKSYTYKDSFFMSLVLSTLSGRDITCVLKEPDEHYKDKTTLYCRDIGEYKTMRE